MSRTKVADEKRIQNFGHKPARKGTTGRPRLRWGYNVIINL